MVCNGTLRRILRIFIQISLLYSSIALSLIEVSTMVSRPISNSVIDKILRRLIVNQLSYGKGTPQKGMAKSRPSSRNKLANVVVAFVQSAKCLGEFVHCNSVNMLSR